MNRKLSLSKELIISCLLNRHKIKTKFGDQNVRHTKHVLRVNDGSLDRLDRNFTDSFLKHLVRE